MYFFFIVDDIVGFDGVCGVCVLFDVDEFWYDLFLLGLWIY